MSRRWLAISATVSLMTVAALQVTVQAAPEVTLTFLTHQNAPTQAVEHRLISQFERLHPGVKVNELVEEPGTTYAKFLSLATAGKAPDLYDMAQNYFASLVTKGVLAPIDLKAVGANSLAALKGRYIANALSGYTSRGKVYALPYELSNYVAWYNPGMYAAAHLPLPHTWAQVAADGPKLYKTSGGKVTQVELALPINFPAAQVLVFDTIASEAGHALFNSAGTKSFVDSAAAVRALTMLQQLVYKYHAVDPALNGTVIGQERNLFMAGTTGMNLDGGSWFGPLYQSTNPKLAAKAVAAPYPSFPGGQTSADNYGYGLVVSSQSPHQALAWELANFLAEHGGAFFSQGLFLGLKAINGDPQAKRQKFWNSVFVPTLAKGHYFPSLINSTQIDQIIANAMDAALLKDANVVQTLRQAQAQIIPLLNH